MPFGSYQINKTEALKNSIRLIKEGGAEAVKLEGGKEISTVVKNLTEYGINVVAHIGLMPQYVHKMGGFKIQGKDNCIADKLIEDALALEDAGASIIVLEGILPELASKITHKLKIPTIGIGAGKDCDGQILVFHDYLGINIDFKPSFVKAYAVISDNIKDATDKYIYEVKKGLFP
jgi:3-methyl-2-oxobutanoate hydroxymethyltransferase